MKILIVVDMQNDFIDGSLGTKEAQSIVPHVIDKIKKFANKLQRKILQCYIMIRVYEPIGQIYGVTSHSLL